jgi:hypothetical protein
MKIKNLFFASTIIFGSLCLFSYGKKATNKKDSWVGWHRPVDANVFTTTKGNSHDSVLFVEPELEYPYYLIVSHTTKFAHLWQGKVFRMRKVQFVAVTGK